MKNKNIGKLIRGMVKKEVFVVMAELHELNKKELFTKKETAEMLSISPRQLDRWRNEGKINSLKSGEKEKVLFTKKEIVRSLKAMGHGG